MHAVTMPLAEAIETTHIHCVVGLTGARGVLFLDELLDQRSSAVLPACCEYDGGSPHQETISARMTIVGTSGRPSGGGRQPGWAATRGSEQAGTMPIPEWLLVSNDGQMAPRSPTPRMGGATVGEGG
jgi:hypothetical protein